MSQVAHQAGAYPGFCSTLPMRPARLPLKVLILKCHWFSCRHTQRTLHTVAMSAVRGTGSQNWTLLPKQHENSLFLQLTQIKAMLMLHWPHIVVNLRITVLIWWGTTHFVQNNKDVIIPGNTQQIDVGTKLKAWRQRYFIIFIFTMIIWYGL